MVIMVAAEDTMVAVVMAAEDTTAAGEGIMAVGAMVMVDIRVMAFILEPRFIPIIPIRTLIIIIRQLLSLYRSRHRFTSSSLHRPHNNIRPVTGITAPTLKAITLI